MIEVIAVVGPTASGKTALAIAIAEQLGTEIISADSMQVYRGMAIGTAAPSADELARVKHHFIGTLEPGAPWSAGAFELAARPIVQALNTQGKPAVIAGGSGLYVQALIDGLIDVPPANEIIRDRLAAEADDLGTAALYERLQAIDPDYAGVIHPHDLRRIVRGLEVYEACGTPLGQLHAAHRGGMKPLHAIQVAINHPRPELYARINARAEQMLAAGFLDELRQLLDAGYGSHLEKLRTLGYREFMAHLRGECSYESALDAMKQNTRRFAKRQLTWFRADDRIEWILVEGVATAAEQIVARTKE